MIYNDISMAIKTRGLDTKGCLYLMKHKLQITFHPNHLGLSHNENSLDTVIRMIAWSHETREDREMAWADKYGVDIENDVFLMRQFCWCEKAGECPWCTGCAIYRNTKECRACGESYPHTATCYQTEMNRARQAAGLSYALDETFVEESVTRSWEERTRIEDAIYDELCSQHSLDRKFGCAMHCDCGAEEARRKAIEDHGCDYQMGRGIFARFHPYIHDHERNYYDPPNFWYKPTDFRVIWYKYIGRDTRTNRVLREGELEQIVRKCIPRSAEAYRAVCNAADDRSEEMSRLVSQMNS